MARTRRHRLAAALGAALLAALVQATGVLKPWEWRAYDLRLALLAEDAPDSRIAVVAIDDPSLAAAGRWPWPRAVQARLVEALAAAGARVIALDIEYPEASQDPAADAAFARVAEAAGRVVVGSYGRLRTVAGTGPLTADSFPPPTPAIAAAVDVGAINVTAADDGFVRRYPTVIAHPGGSLPSLGLAALARHLAAAPPAWDGRAPAVSFAGRAIPVDRAGRFLINYALPSAFPVLSAGDVLAGRFDPALVRGRLVFVGLWSPTLGDQRSLPAHRPTLQPGVLVHANAVKTVLDGSFIAPAPPGVNPALTFVLTLAAGLLFARLGAATGALALGTLGITWGAANLVLLSRGLLLDLLHPTLGLAMAYLTALAAHLAAERGERLRITSVFQRYVAPQVVREILARGEEALRLGGVRRPVTVLFLDVRGFTPMAERLPPEQVVAALNRCFETITRVIFQHGGTLDKFMGDAVMALFNAPLDLPDHPLRAVEAAREIQARAPALEAELAAAGLPPLRFGIGIHTGEAVVGNVGSRHRLEYTAIGDTVNLAARLESLAEPGQILISEAVWRAVAGRVEADPVGELPVKGKSAPVRAYAVRVPSAPADPRRQTRADGPGDP